MPEEQAPEAFGSPPCVLIFSPFPYSRFWGCRVIEPVYPDDTGEVTKRSHQLARATSAVPWEAFSPAESYLLFAWENAERGQVLALLPGSHKCLCQSPLCKALNWSLIYLVSSWGWAERTCPHSSDQCPLWKGPRSSFHRDWIAGGYAWAGTWAGVTLICKIRPLCSGLGRVPGKGEGDRGHILIQEGWADPSYVRWVIQTTFKSTS